MLLEIDGHSGVPIYRQVMDQVRYQVAAGVLTEGEQLPSVRELSKQLQVNPMTVSKAYGFLEAEGILRRARGVGLFVAEGSGAKREAEGEKVVRAALEQAAAEARLMNVSEKRFMELAKEIYGE